MPTKEEEFKKWLMTELKKNNGAILVYKALNAGAAHCNCSQVTIDRYLKKLVYLKEVGFADTGERTMNGHRIYNVVLMPT